MSRGQKKRIKAVREIIERTGFRCDDIATSNGGHLECRITDNEGNKFKAYTGVSCSANQKNALLNFKQDIRRLSHAAKSRAA